jgi:hypothetical protein
MVEEYPRNLTELEATFATEEAPAERTWPGYDGRMAFGVHAVAVAGHGLCEVCCSSVRLVAVNPR